MMHATVQAWQPTHSRRSTSIAQCGLPPAAACAGTTAAPAVTAGSALRKFLRLNVPDMADSSSR
jgi:hypothetical protein